ncbi:MAG: bifunctional glutamate N-acetyltransferase/amino-acid acetyltransferase ArgJ [Rhodobacteraceae bacterium]|uniref:bifunctional glutamate N-acetyltransferase/amino-acid acetyltransferase ArgJ n=1 Tax=Thioclava sp. L04-15 TaxID=1915318 RepID=UPI0009964237|nr:bifunctional glutamate N-acetyltransferase/amino-acid acetyltransferase ArgJ [Thioclava sp. L04-15]OOY29734.1 bifunctional ornithine acetyltransferase/N-acetylglutamate synthase [Thioclava sp. L04-15]TNE93618.1 MAG: bifunctional glutamate N-acetyltransferase/amino-acid acetyltransferase ArgJ [Paracoccaceae bacterium]TNF14068.1 MAG: bifunctional glutamate N-acetyltransferase/amino-acid acetyltransferase ArgJ [Paracoccaceae bacterium]
MAKKKSKDDKELKTKVKKLRAKVKALKSDLATSAPAPIKTKAVTVSPLAPEAFPAMPQIAGVEFASAAAGVKYAGRTDVMLAKVAPGSSIAGVFTTSSTRAACVLDCQEKLKMRVPQGAGAAIIVNSGNANAFTGKLGQKAVDLVTEGVAKALDLPASRVFSSSTGVIGEPLPYEKIILAIDTLAERLSPAGIEDAARAIMTTDTYPKGACATVQGEGGEIKIAGIAKGSGMIAPNMATMLVYIFTDAKITPARLQRMLSRQVEDTFNAITVDSDTSTSDALIVAATGQSEAAEISDLRSQVAKDFEAGLRAVMMDLAHQVVKDGEGATKFVEIRVTRAASAEDAHKVAMAVANSPLVKTAIAGEDANWGRVVAAVGKSGAKADRDKLTISFGDMVLAEKGWRVPDYSEEKASAYMKNPELVIGVDLGLGRASKSVWTCDLTHRYIDINADYRS